MKAMLVVLSLVGSLAIVNALGPITAVVIGAKILIAKGFIIGAAKGTLARNLSQGGGREGGRGRGGHGHGKREAEAAGDFNAVLVDQYQKDSDDCAKVLICTLNSKPLNKLDVSNSILGYEI